jgi:hypothetical protein
VAVLQEATFLQEAALSWGVAHIQEVEKEVRGHIIELKLQGGHFDASFHPHQLPTTLKCYLCVEPHFHRDHQGNARWLALNEQGKWIDKALGNKIVCIAFNSGPNSFR